MTYILLYRRKVGENHCRLTIQTVTNVRVSEDEPTSGGFSREEFHILIRTGDLNTTVHRRVTGNLTSRGQNEVLHFVSLEVDNGWFTVHPYLYHPNIR